MIFGSDWKASQGSSRILEKSEMNRDFTLYFSTLKGSSFSSAGSHFVYPSH